MLKWDALSEGTGEEKIDIPSTMTKGKHLKGENRLIVELCALLLVAAAFPPLIIKQKSQVCSTTKLHAFIVTQQAHREQKSAHDLCTVVVELLLHNLEINFRPPKKKFHENRLIATDEAKSGNWKRKKENNYVVAEKLMLANVSMTKWNQLEPHSNGEDLFARWNLKNRTLITCRDFLFFFFSFWPFSSATTTATPSGWGLLTVDDGESVSSQPRQKRQIIYSHSHFIFFFVLMVLSAR